jgi:hypothetical protein
MNDLKNKLIAEFGIPEDKLSNSVIQKCAEDSNFLSDLLVCWRDDFMYELLVRQLPSDCHISSTNLLKKSTESAIKWLTNGMRFAPRETYKQRLETCARCQYLSNPSNAIVYKLSGTKKICGLCGCDVSKKARLLSEACPDSTNGIYGRWEQ